MGKGRRRGDVYGRGSAVGVVIRRAEGRDAARLTRLVRGSGAYEGRYAAMVSGYRVGPDYIEAHRVFVAVEEDPSNAGCGGTESPTGRVLGFYSLIAEPAELDLMFVADEAQGLGIGRRLVEHMRGEARRIGVESVRVVSHPPAEGFYRSMGARPSGTVRANPPAVMWDRPEFTFPVGERAE
ncbi:GNAT family N-acetyltransferase [Streptomyces lydicus]|uniref:GNAT family N-acetyltransferase n=1 Tax=Streptomyces lydicus TaxID=47763 RepID=UPI00286FD29E|nr:GNAT family N-acetyltransferase [Streptomyces lydicus]